MKKVLVSATSIIDGGALNILKQFIINAPVNIDFVIAINDKVFIEDLISIKKNIIFFRVKENSRFDRLKWDIFGAKSFVKKNGYKFDSVISLQNTSLNVFNIKQIIYIHQGLFLSDKNWNPFKKSERKYAFYKYIYPFFIFSFSKKNTDYVVQTEWMRIKLHNKYHRKLSRIHNIKPDIAPWNKCASRLSTIEYEKFIFYPATGELFKNHLLILEALKKLHLMFRGNINFKVVFTLNANDQENKHIYEFLKNNNELYKYILLVGQISYNDVRSYYENCHAVIFPSEIESFGLPLLEASMLGKKILSLDTDFAREVLNEYHGVEYISKDIDCWCDKLLNLLFDEKVEYTNFTPDYDNNWNDFFKLI